MLKDKDIREALFDYLESQYKKARFFEEKMIGKSRADVIMVITSALVGVEIKSDADTYARLEGQIKDYDRYFDYNIVVAGGSHGLHVAEHVPDYWGIITVDEVDGQPDFYFLRRPGANSKVKLEKRLELLWRPELGVILESFNLPAYKSQGKPFIRKKLIEFTKKPITKAEEARIRKAAKQNGVEPEIPTSKVDPNELKYQVSEVLFERDEQKLLAEISEYRKMNNPRRRGPKKSTSVRRILRRAKKA